MQSAGKSAREIARAARKERHKIQNRFGKGSAKKIEKESTLAESSQIVASSGGENEENGCEDLERLKNQGSVRQSAGL